MTTLGTTRPVSGDLSRIGCGEARADLCWLAACGTSCTSISSGAARLFLNTTPRFFQAAKPRIPRQITMTMMPTMTPPDADAVDRVYRPVLKQAEVWFQFGFAIRLVDRAGFVMDFQVIAVSV